jgi:hypothetical protein
MGSLLLVLLLADPAHRVTCASNGGRVYCPAAALYGVRVDHQLSKAACTESSTWGYDVNGIWVEGGCRAVFALGDEKHRYHSNNSPYGGARTVACSSENGQRWKCEADTRFGISLTRQLSKEPCVFNQTWGYEKDHVWVTKGCRAEFGLGH